MEKKLNPEILKKLRPTKIEQSHIDDAKELQFKVDRLSQKVNLLEARLQNIATELREANTKLGTKISVVTLENTKTEALIDRHNHIVHSFETKLLQMQKIVDEQEIQLTNTLQELQLARVELTRIRRF